MPQSIRVEQRSLMLNFFVGVLAVIIPHIWGDGIHDDTDGIEAMVCGRKFTAEPNAVKVTRRVDGTPDFKLTGTYKLPRGLPTRKGGPTVLPPPNARTYEIDCAATT